jgi:hypothetical protein
MLSEWSNMERLETDLHTEVHQTSTDPLLQANRSCSTLKSTVTALISRTQSLQHTRNELKRTQSDLEEQQDLNQFQITFISQKQDEIAALKAQLAVAVTLLPTESQWNHTNPQWHQPARAGAGAGATGASAVILSATKHADGSYACKQCSSVYTGVEAKLNLKAHVRKKHASPAARSLSSVARERERATEQTSNGNPPSRICTVSDAAYQPPDCGNHFTRRTNMEKHQSKQGRCKGKPSKGNADGGHAAVETNSNDTGVTYASIVYEASKPDSRLPSHAAKQSEASAESNDANPAVGRSKRRRLSTPYKITAISGKRVKVWRLEYQGVYGNKNRGQTTGWLSLPELRQHGGVDSGDPANYIDAMVHAYDLRHPDYPGAWN